MFSFHISIKSFIALTLDAKENSHPIEREINHPSQISESFDNISYDKGASVIKMLSKYIGEGNFQTGTSR